MIQKLKEKLEEKKKKIDTLINFNEEKSPLRA